MVDARCPFIGALVVPVSTLLISCPYLHRLEYPFTSMFVFFNSYCFQTSDRYLISQFILTYFGLHSINSCNFTTRYDFHTSHCNHYINKSNLDQSKFRLQTKTNLGSSSLQEIQRITILTQKCKSH